MKLNPDDPGNVTINGVTMRRPPPTLFAALRGPTQPPPPPPSSLAKWVFVTPEMAYRWLVEKNINNRPVIKSLIDRFMTDIATDSFCSENGETISFGYETEGGPEILFDGQHRLWAIFLSGRGMWCLVVYGLPPKARKTIDTCPGRTTGTIFKLCLGNPDGTLDVAICQSIGLLLTKTNDKMSVSFIEGMIQQYQEGINFIHSIQHSEHHLDRTLGKVTVLAGMVYAYPRAKAIIRDFVLRYRSGSNLSQGDPELTLREFIMRRIPKIKPDRRAITIKTLRAIRGRIQGEHLSRLEASEEVITYFKAGYAGR